MLENIEQVMLERGQRLQLIQEKMNTVEDEVFGEFAHCLLSSLNKTGASVCLKRVVGVLYFTTVLCYNFLFYSYSPYARIRH